MPWNNRSMSGGVPAVPLGMIGTLGSDQVLLLFLPTMPGCMDRVPVLTGFGISVGSALSFTPEPARRSLAPVFVHTPAAFGTRLKAVCGAMTTRSTKGLVICAIYLTSGLVGCLVGGAAS